MKLWQDLVNSALFGTERRPWQATSGSAPVETLLQGIAVESPAGLLLRAAGVLSVHRRTGELPARSTNAAPSLCPAESLPRSGPRVAEHLAAMVNGRYPELISIALETMAESGQRLPEELLPGFLELTERKRSLRAPLSAVAGTHGKWLAAQNPEWDWMNVEDALPDNLRSLWETGSMSQRLGLLQQLRKSDPAGAVELIVSTWDQEKAEPRAQLLGTLRTGLSMADEPFLEERLDDRSTSVRRAAADLLANLATSRLSLRMQARLLPLLRLESKGLLRRTEVLEVMLPEDADAAIQRDGIRPQAGGQAGAKASLVAQMLALVPPSLWSQEFSRSPQELLAAAAASDWKEWLRTAWVKATARHGDREWARALVQALGEQATPVLQLLPEQERDAFLCDAMDNVNDGLLIVQFSRFSGAWSPRLTRALLKRIRKAKDNDLKDLCRLAMAALPSLDPEAAADISADWPPEMSDLAAGLQFKHDLVRDIRKRC